MVARILVERGDQWRRTVKWERYLREVCNLCACRHDDTACVGLQLPCDDLQLGGLSSTIVAHKPNPLAFLTLQSIATPEYEQGSMFVQATALQQRGPIACKLRVVAYREIAVKASGR